MPAHLQSGEVLSAFAASRLGQDVAIEIDQQTVTIHKPFSSPADWRDSWIYFLLVDRFNNPIAPPRHLPFDGEHGVFQGGNFEGIREQLGYLKDLGVGAIWLSPVVKNCQYEDGSFHGYGFQDFLRVEPRFCSDPEAARTDPRLADAELERLIDEAHARGIYVIFDIVLNHAGNVFDYDGHGSAAPWRDSRYPIHWRNEQGSPAFPSFASAPPVIHRDAAIWPRELQRNDYFRRQGKGGELGGDFESLKEFVTGFVEDSATGVRWPVRDALIRSFQYLIARFDVDGFRIDTLKYIEPDFARIFANSMREFALSIGKKNFLTYGEVYDGEEQIARFVGRNANETGDPIGVDAALDFPLFFILPSVMKGFTPPSALADLFEHRKAVQRGILTSHGEASGHFVTFADNHDQNQRIYYQDPNDPARFDHQLTATLAALFSMQGIPCLYYGTEQGLHGKGGRDSAVREALWGKANGFDRGHAFYLATQRLAEIRAKEPALRYGRQYFRQLSGDGFHYGYSRLSPGVVAFSRILNNRELLIVINTNTTGAFTGSVVVDASLQPAGTPATLLFTNAQPGAGFGAVERRERGAVEVEELDGSRGSGPVHVLPVALDATEAKILRLGD